MTEDQGQGLPLVRQAMPADAARLAEVSARLFRQTFASVNTAEDMDLYERQSFTEDVQRAELERDDHVVFLVETPSGNAVGYAVLCRGARDDAVDADRPAEIQRFYIDQRFHGRGLAQTLMQASLDQCSAWQCDVVWLGVWERNARAIAFYEKHGFRRVGGKTFILGTDVQHDFVMARSLG